MVMSKRSKIEAAVNSALQLGALDEEAYTPRKDDKLKADSLIAVLMGPMKPREQLATIRKLEARTWR